MQSDVDVSSMQYRCMMYLPPHFIRFYLLFEVVQVRHMTRTSPGQFVFTRCAEEMECKLPHSLAVQVQGVFELIRQQTCLQTPTLRAGCACLLQCEARRRPFKQPGAPPCMPCCHAHPCTIEKLKSTLDILDIQLKPTETSRRHHVGKT